MTAQRLLGIAARILRAVTVTAGMLLAACGGNVSTSPATGSSSANSSAPAPTTTDGATTGAPPRAAIQTPVTVQTTDPCTLLTSAEVEAANGPGLAAGQRGRGASLNQCEFREQASGRLVSVSIDRGPQVRAELDQLRRMFAQGLEEVPALGDQSFLATAPRAIYVLKGDALLSIQIVGAAVVDGADLRTRLTGLMTKALSRL